MKRRTVLVAYGGSSWSPARCSRASAAEFPPDTQPDGATCASRTTISRARRARSLLPEDAAQHATFTIRDFRAKAAARRDALPEPERSKLMASYHEIASAPDGPSVSDPGARARLDRAAAQDLSESLRSDRGRARDGRHRARDPLLLSPARQRHLGLTMFTAELLVEADAPARDFDVVLRASETTPPATETERPWRLSQIQRNASGRQGGRQRTPGDRRVSNRVHTALNPPPLLPWRRWRAAWRPWRSSGSGATRRTWI